MDLPWVSKLYVQTMGRPVFLVAIIAHSISSSDDMVSIQTTSTPPSLSAIAWSVNADSTSALVSSPRGSMIPPDGPIEPATIIVRSQKSAALSAISAPATLSS